MTRPSDRMLDALQKGAHVSAVIELSNQSSVDMEGEARFVNVDFFEHTDEMLVLIGLAPIGEPNGGIGYVVVPARELPNVQANGDSQWSLQYCQHGAEFSLNVDTGSDPSAPGATSSETDSRRDKV